MTSSIEQQLLPISEPPFCPHAGCEAQHPASPGETWWWYRNGSYRTQFSGVVQRFRCRCCGGGFSEQSFHLDYYAKRRLDYTELTAAISSCMGQRAIGRLYGVDHKTVANKVMRFARQAMATQAQLWDQLQLMEDVVADGFESFWVSQYFPNNLHLLVGADTQFLYAYNGVTIRRSGRMTEQQRQRREQLERRFRAEPKEIERSFSELLDLVVQFIDGGTRDVHQLRSDEHRAYQRAVATHGAFAELAHNGRAIHRRIPSTRPRNRANPLFAVNYFDRQMRKDLAEHVRESTRFSRSAAGSFDRLAVYCFAHNLTKPFRINQPRRYAGRTHAERAGIEREQVEAILSTVYHRRAFRSRSALRGPLLWQWLRLYPTPLQRSRAYLPRYLLD